MKKYVGLFSLLSVLLLMNGCQKEMSFENGQNQSSGALQLNGTGDCLPKNVSGIYEKGTALDPTTNFIDVQVDVSKAGSYIVSTDTVNGIYFRSAGVFTSTGLNTVTLKGSGTPLADGITNFVVSYDTTQCSVPVTILPEGGAVPAVYSLSGTPATCLSFTMGGVYIVGTVLNPSNTVVLNVDVTTIGTYNITTNTVNGIKFSGSGALTATGAQTITLVGSGTPSVAGTTQVPVVAPGSSCSFDVPIVSAGTFAVNCGSEIINGEYVKGVALSAGNTIELDVSVTTPGAYSISNSADGMTFSASGTFTTAGATEHVVLQGSGTPAEDGLFPLNITAGTSPCSFDLLVDFGEPLAATGSWKFVEDGTTYQGTFSGADNEVSGGVTIFDAYGEAGSGGTFDLFIVDLSGGINNNETYSTVYPPVGNTAGFGYQTPTKSYIADPSDPTSPTSTVTVKITSKTGNTIIGTFSGGAKDENGVSKTITFGEFTITTQ